MTGEISSLMRNEVQLAKVELKEEAGRAGKAGGMLGAGALTAYFALLFASLAMAWLLDQVMPIAQATDRLMGTPQAVSQAATQQAQGSPIAAGLLAFGAGFVVASLVKGTQAEARSPRRRSTPPSL